MTDRINSDLPLSEQLIAAFDEGCSRTDSPEYKEGYQDGFQEGVELVALALACKLGWSVQEVMDHVPESIDETRLAAFLTENGIPEK